MVPFNILFANQSRSRTTLVLYNLGYTHYDARCAQKASRCMCAVTRRSFGDAQAWLRAIVVMRNLG